MLNISSNVKDFERGLSDVAKKQLPYALMLTINDTAKDALEVVKREIDRKFDRPTRWTRNAFRIKYAKKTDLNATILRKDAVGRRFYLEVQQKGGVRKQTGIEKLLSSRLAYSGIIRTVTPASGMRKNTYGNMSPGHLQQVLSGIKAQADKAQNTTKRSTRRNSRRARFFVAKPGGHLSPGVYSAKGKKIRKVLHFSDGNARYQKRFQFDAVTRKKALQKFGKHFEINMKKAMATRR